MVSGPKSIVHLVLKVGSNSTRNSKSENLEPTGMAGRIAARRVPARIVLHTMLAKQHLDVEILEPHHIDLL